MLETRGLDVRPQREIKSNVNHTEGFCLFSHIKYAEKKFTFSLNSTVCVCQGGMSEKRRDKQT